MTYTLPSNMSNMPQLLQGINTMLGNDLVALFTMIMIFTITYMSVSLRLEPEKSILFSSWITTISGFFISIIFNTNPNFVILPILMTAISVILSFRR